MVVVIHTHDEDYSQLHRYSKQQTSERAIEWARETEHKNRRRREKKKKNISLKRAKVGVLNLLTWFVTVSFLIFLTHNRTILEAEKLDTGDRKVCFFDVQMAHITYTFFPRFFFCCSHSIRLSLDVLHQK